MELTVQPGLLSGTVQAIPSKSAAHRLLICAAFADGPTQLLCRETNRDMDATAQCLSALGASILRTQEGYLVSPVRELPHKAHLYPQESGSTLRFLLPVAGALGVNATFHLEGRLGKRPLSPLWEEMERMGCTLSRPDDNTVTVAGKLRPGAYCIDGSVSSQFITGLILALSLLAQPSTLEITGQLESKPYVDMTYQAISLFGGDPGRPGGCCLRSPGTLEVEGDWSNAAFFLAASALGSDVKVTGLDRNSCQGDRAAEDLLAQLQEGSPVIDARDIPDLVPILAVVAAAKQGCTFTNIRRLRLKESDRVEAVLALLKSLGGTAWAEENRLFIRGTGLIGGQADSFADHRIAMACAIASTVCKQPVVLTGAQAVEKSYPRFWEEFSRLGGKI